MEAVKVLAEAIFILSLALAAYTYAGYPVVLFALGRLLGRAPRKRDITPRVSVIIAAYNEEADIAEKLENTLALDYPREKLEIIVASDCSSDRTDEIVTGFGDRGVILHRRPERLGKTSAQNHAVGVSTGEVLLFSDATTMYEPDTLRKIVRSFADTEVGCVTGNVVYVDRASTAVGRGLRSYWGYEFFLKQNESLLCSLIGVCGCLYAVRRSAYVRLAQDMSSDFVIASEIYLQGLRSVYDPEAVSSEDTNNRAKDEFRMRVRIIEQTMSALHRYSEVLNPLRHGLYAFQMISHKVMRYAVPVLMALIFVSNIFLIGSGSLYDYAFAGQAVFYAAALAGWAGDGFGLKLGPLAIPYYFVLSNVAVIFAFVKFVRGEAHVVWQPLRDAAGDEAARTATEGVAG
ncbi:MAG TPA: glycosyltransferase family 2 protein [Blastocatellia bacterium]|jgi:cellulose synthase/poly-beta-1,6-N-acetylglucosamine synthase-like glycosyltransferase|nr:glycosyltransferase family 2 protein [Blastocatellia bacterium]